MSENVIVYPIKSYVWSGRWRGKSLSQQLGSSCMCPVHSTAKGTSMTLFLENIAYGSNQQQYQRKIFKKFALKCQMSESCAQHMPKTQGFFHPKKVDSVFYQMTQLFIMKYLAQHNREIKLQYHADCDWI